MNVGTLNTQKLGYPGIFVQGLNDNNQPDITFGYRSRYGQLAKSIWLFDRYRRWSSFLLFMHLASQTKRIVCLILINLQAMDPVQFNVALFILAIISMGNVRGAARNGGGFEIVFQDNNLDGNATHFQMVWRGYEADNVTPINNAAEVRVSTVTNSNNINGQISVNADNSGAVTWQRLLAGSTTNQLVMRSLLTIVFIVIQFYQIPVEQLPLPTTTLPRL